MSLPSLYLVSVLTFLLHPYILTIFRENNLLLVNTIQLGQNATRWALYKVYVPCMYTEYTPK